MIFRLGVRTCEPRSRAFIICFYARSPEEGPASTWTARCHPARSEMDESGLKGSGEVEGEGERGGERGPRAKRA